MRQADGLLAARITRRVDAASSGWFAAYTASPVIDKTADIFCSLTVFLVRGLLFRHQFTVYSTSDQSLAAYLPHYSLILVFKAGFSADKHGETHSEATADQVLQTANHLSFLLKRRT